MCSPHRGVGPGEHYENPQFTYADLKQGTNQILACADNINTVAENVNKTKKKPIASLEAGNEVGLEGNPDEISTC
jgi:hypothetical protein